MKNIGIYCYVFNDNFKWDENGKCYNNIGYSEYWVINLSNELKKRGYNVYVFGNPTENHVSDGGVNYLNYKELKDTCDKVSFCKFILVRDLRVIKDIKCDDILFISDDENISNINGEITIETLSKINKFFVFSDYQRKKLKSRYNIDDKRIYDVSASIDFSEYDKYSDMKKKNMVTFSSDNKDFLRWFVENVFDRVKSFVDDFEINVCDYGTGFVNSEILKRDGINIISVKSWDTLAKLQSESKIWVSCNHGYNFCYDESSEFVSISALENAYAKCACIFGDWGCYSSLFEGYSGFIGGELYDNKIDPIEYDKLDKFADCIVDECVKCLADEKYRLSKVNETYEIAKQYTVEKYTDLVESAFNNNSVNANKVLVCCIGRLENRYIREFVEYYRMLGVSNICLYDNNRDGEDDFRDVIGDYIDSGFVILKDKRNVTVPCQLQSYNECYKEYGKNYDWIAFLDIDEFVFMHDSTNIADYLAKERYDKFDAVCLNWLMFGDNDLVYYENRPCMERFTKPLPVDGVKIGGRFDYPESFTVKTIVRGGLDSVVFKDTPHCPISDLKTCNSSGIEIRSNWPFTPYDFRTGGILHFCTKTAEEYSNKVNRGFCDGNGVKKEELIRLFFRRNKVTEEKVNLFKERNGVDVSYLLPYKGEKRTDVKIFSLCYEKKDFNFIDDAVITPLQVGASRGDNICQLKDNEGDNISNANYFYVENTGSYWIWKNVSGCTYKGQMQYRRPLSGVNETMDFDEIFKDYDVITCEPFNHPKNSLPTKDNPMCIPAQTVEGGYGFSNCLDDLYILEMAIKYYFPDYSDDYDKYIKKGENLYYSNGFVMKSEDYDRYCEFLFACLNGYLAFANIHSEQELYDHVKYNIDTGKYIRYNEKHPVTEEGFKWQTRIGGFLSERIWTLWLQHNFSHDKIYELPYIKMEENMYT